MESISDLSTKFKNEHHEVYSQMEYFMNELVKVKKIPNNQHLLKTANSMVDYISELLNTHFKEEEEKFFPYLISTLKNSNQYSPEEQAELAKQVEILLNEHKQIKEKLSNIEDIVSNIDIGNLDNLDLKQNLLFPLYNLIATINHHADREDNQVFKKLSQI